MPVHRSLPAYLPAERPGTAAPAELAARRQGLTAAQAAGMWRTDPPPEESTIGGVRVLRFGAPGAAKATLLHLHGGAFRIGSPEVVGRFAAALAKRCAITVICPAYRLAPEHPFPAGLADAWAVLTALQTANVERLLVSGDSAGGGLAASLTAIAVRENATVAGLALLSPWLDLTVTSECYLQNGSGDPLFSAAAAREAATLYLQGHSPRDPLVSPLLGPAAGFPPTFVNVGKGEVLADDAIRFAGKLRTANIPVTLDVVPAMEHVAVTRDFALIGASHTFAMLAAFVDTVLNSPKDMD